MGPVSRQVPLKPLIALKHVLMIYISLRRVTDTYRVDWTTATPTADDVHRERERSLVSWSTEQADCSWLAGHVGEDEGGLLPNKANVTVSVA